LQKRSHRRGRDSSTPSSNVALRLLHFLHPMINVFFDVG
jgi:hypothetical protein